MHILAGDIGGTNARLLCADSNASAGQIMAEKNYACAEYDDLLQVIAAFISEHKIPLPVAAACFAIAGPVESGVATVTNLPWVISEQQLAEVLGTAKVKLVNDFVAAAYGISELPESDMLLLQQGKTDADRLVTKDAVIVGAGTGLGVSHLVWLDDHYRVLSSESGHAGFAPENNQQSELLLWLQQKHAHVCLEMLLSGNGLQTIYAFLNQAKGLSESPVIKQAMKETDPSQVITGHALAEDDELCIKTLELFIEIYGAAAGNAVLQYYPVSQLYIAGGIAPKIKDKMTGQRFLDAFHNKGLMSSNMEKITIKLVTQEKVGLFGALSLSCLCLVEVAAKSGHSQKKPSWI